LQCACWGGFFTAEYGHFNIAEYEMYIGIALMMLIGFGYLMTFLKAYGLGAVGFTFIITCLSVQMNMFLAALIPNVGKLTPADIQNATLAGGVAVGAVARMNIGLGWASICGSVGGILSTLGYQYIQPFLQRKIGLYDTCGVNNLHGIPGLFGSIISCIFCVTAWEPWMSWPKDQIGLYQFASLASTLGMAIVTGVFTGYVCKFCKNTIKKINAPKNATPTDLDNSVHFNDFSYWKASEDASQHGEKPGSVSVTDTNQSV